ncbi:hypothetical protein [Vibrio sp. AND4]|uniref:hypothetical protein n=1 Tax=Vibrio sp. AND4 TaxID=314289 RepID=UPI00117D2E28|nr:hypothetical protein [Vibrio sp. AND4]
MRSQHMLTIHCSKQLRWNVDLVLPPKQDGSKLLEKKVKMKFLIIILSFFLMSCERGADLENTKEYSNNKVTFKYPGNWEVTEDSETEDFRFIFVESPGSGIMRIEIYNHEDSFKLKEFVKLDIEYLLGTVPKFFDVEYPELIRGSKKNIGNSILSGLTYELDYRTFGIDITSIIETYKISNEIKTAYLSGQVPKEDRHLVSSGFDLILSSFRILPTEKHIEQTVCTHQG